MRPSEYKIVFQRLFNFKGFKLCGILSSKGTVEVSLQRTGITGNCPRCGRKRQKVIEEYFRTVRDLDLCDKKCSLRFVVYRIDCSCGYFGIEHLDFIDKCSRYTNRFVEYTAVLCQKMSLSDVAKTMKINWKTAKHIDKCKLRELVVDIESCSPKILGIDEVAYKKGHKYLTVVRDAEEGRVIWVKEGRSKEVLDEFFKKLGIRKCLDIRKVIVDMWDPYIASIKENTDAVIIFDKFHIAKKINEAVDDVRKEEFAKADPEERKRMKKKRFLLLARQKNLNDEKRESLYSLKEVNQTLYAAYLIKEQALDILDEEDEDRAMQRLDRWFENVGKAGIEQFFSVVETMKSYLYGVHNYFRFNLTNAASEGFNNKIAVIRRRAYGFRDLEYFKLKILQACSGT